MQLGISTSYSQRNNSPGFGFTLKFSDKNTLQKATDLFNKKFTTLANLEKGTGKIKNFKSYVKNAIDGGYLPSDVNTRNLFVYENVDLKYIKSEKGMSRQFKRTQFRNLSCNPCEAVNVTEKDVNSALGLLAKQEKFGKKQKLNFFEKIISKKVNKKIEELRNLRRNPVGILLDAKLGEA